MNETLEQLIQDAQMALENIQSNPSPIFRKGSAEWLLRISQDILKHFPQNPAPSPSENGNPAEPPAQDQSPQDTHKTVATHPLGFDAQELKTALDRVSSIPQLPHTKMRSPHEVAQLRELRKTAVPSVPPASLEITVNINLRTVNPPKP